jgi:hypothetical protein
MPNRRLRKLFIDRAIQKLKLISEIGLAGLVTAGVAACGGEQLGIIPEGGADAEFDSNSPPFSDGGVVVEATIDANRAEAIGEGICTMCDDAGCHPCEPDGGKDSGFNGDSGDEGGDGGFDGGDAGLDGGGADADGPVDQ